MLADDLSIANHKRIFEICDLLEREKLNLKWTAVGRVNLVNEKLLRRMKSAGVDLIGFGIESGSQKILDNINKQVKVKTAAKAIILSKKLGFITICSFMIGNVGETRETVFESVDFINKYLNTTIVFFLTTPYPETELFQYAEEHGLIKDKINLFENYGEQGSKLLVNLTEMSDEELWALKHKAENAILKYYFKNHPVKGFIFLLKKLRLILKMLIINFKEHGLKQVFGKNKSSIYKIRKKVLKIT